MSKNVLITAAFLCSAAIFSTGAAADSFADLGGKLTPIGAERAGNAEGTIPAWEGGITTPPAGYRLGGDYVDPYAGDKKLFSIDGANAAQYKDKLTAGQQYLLAHYKDYRMDVYPTRRSCAYPDWLYKKTKEGAGVARLDAATKDLIAAMPGSVPFPVPTDGAEVMWNHRTAFDSFGRNVSGTTAVVDKGGKYVPLKWDEARLSNYYDPANTTFEALNNIQLKYFTTYTAPARVAGEMYLVHETLNGERNAWLYSPGLRRVRRAPTISYDNPVSGYEGLAASDQLYMYNGRLDRYDWKLVGKKELYIPYNNFEFANSKHKVAELAEPNFPDPDVGRYELHRVWVVEANLKPGLRHLLPKRIFYVDEDSWRVVATDIYDAQGKFWRYQEETTVPVYDLPACFGFGQAIYDFQVGRYVLDLVFNDDKRPDFHAERQGVLDETMFDVGELRKRGTR